MGGLYDVISEQSLVSILAVAVAINCIATTALDTAVELFLLQGQEADLAVGR